jgi:hypothetical protein
VAAVKAMLILAMAAVLIVAAPAPADDEVQLVPPTAAGRVEVPVAKQAMPFTARAAARSVRRALRAHGFAGATASCVRAGRRCARCTVTAVSDGAWTGTAEVSRAKRVDHVEYEVRGA